MVDQIGYDWLSYSSDIVICGYCGKRIRRNPASKDGINYHEHCKKWVENDERGDR